MCAADWMMHCLVLPDVLIVMNLELEAHILHILCLTGTPKRLVNESFAVSQ